VSFFVVAINLVLKALLQGLVAFERHWTRSDKARAYAVEAFVSQLLNSVLVLLLVNAKARRAGRGAEDRPRRACCGRTPPLPGRGARGARPASPQRAVPHCAFPLALPAVRHGDCVAACGASSPHIRPHAPAPLPVLQVDSASAAIDRGIALSSAGDAGRPFRSLLLAGSYPDFSPGWCALAGCGCRAIQSGGARGSSAHPRPAQK
jgi:hypothetical protein